MVRITDSCQRSAVSYRTTTDRVGVCDWARRGDAARRRGQRLVSSAPNRCCSSRHVRRTVRSTSTACISNSAPISAYE
jgi:hypothetical protein